MTDQLLSSDDHGNTIDNTGRLVNDDGTEPTAPTTPTPAEVIQTAQTAIGRLQMKYRDTTPDFWALAVAWEAARFAWYVVEGDRGTAADKLHLLKNAIADYERKTAPKEG